MQAWVTSALSPLIQPSSKPSPAPQGRSDGITAASVSETLQVLAYGPKDAPKKRIELTETDELLFRYLGKQSPVIPLGCFVTMAVLGTSFYHFKMENKRQAQVFMRARVFCQGVTLVAMMTSLSVQAKEKAWIKQQLEDAEGA
mmetsp:Transcript_32227/g.81154  ORF Transcript_32227/g.81154 Transcript_32227/m.81154 type:complete len:143 (+) Transcript_32227:26-454(+)